MPRPRKGLPVLHRSSSCMHAVAITPVESQSASFALFLCNISLPRNHGGSASTSRLSRPAQRSLALRPAYSPSHFHDPLHRRLQPFRYLHNCSDCYRLERKLPGGICTRWKTVPLHGAHDNRTLSFTAVHSNSTSRLHSLCGRIIHGLRGLLVDSFVEPDCSGCPRRPELPQKKQVVRQNSNGFDAATRSDVDTD